MENQDSCLGTSLGCLYAIPSQIIMLIVWAGGGLSLFASGDLLERVVWVLFLGPIVGEVVGLLWPLFLILWLIS